MTEQDFLNIIGNKISNEMQKTIIRNNYAPQTAELLCNVIDSREKDFYIWVLKCIIINNRDNCSESYYSDKWLIGWFYEQ